MLFVARLQIVNMQSNSCSFFGFFSFTARKDVFFNGREHKMDSIMSNHVFLLFLEGPILLSHSMVKEEVVSLAHLKSKDVLTLLLQLQGNDLRICRFPFVVSVYMCSSFLLCFFFFEYMVLPLVC